MYQPGLGGQVRYRLEGESAGVRTFYRGGGGQCAGLVSWKTREDVKNPNSGPHCTLPCFRMKGAPSDPSPGQLVSFGKLILPPGAPLTLLIHRNGRNHDFFYFKCLLDFLLSNYLSLSVFFS